MTTTDFICVGLVMAGELGGWNQAIGASPYNNRWRHMRRLFHNAIGTPAANERFNSGKECEARRLLRNVLANPEKLVDHLRLLALFALFFGDHFDLFCFVGQLGRQCSVIHMGMKLSTKNMTLLSPSLMKPLTNSPVRQFHRITWSNSFLGVSTCIISNPPFGIQIVDFVLR